MKLYQEITNEYPAHTYLLDDTKTKMYGYIPKGSKTMIKTQNPKGFLKFDPRHRTFKEVK